MARPGHRPLTSYRAFGLFVALWAAALCGLVVFVLPDAVLARGVSATGLAPALEDRGITSEMIKIAASGIAAAMGGAVGLLAVALVGRRYRYDPRPVYAEDDFHAPHVDEEIEKPEPTRRPLHIREELAEGMRDIEEPARGRAPFSQDADTGGETVVVEIENAEAGAEDEELPQLDLAVTPHGAMERRSDIPALLDQFDRALARFREGDTPPPRKEAVEPEDPLRTFLARQAGEPPRSAPRAAWPFDHQAELRLALDKLARARSKD